MCNLLGITDYNIFYDNLKNQLFERTGRNASRIKAIEDLGLLSEELVVKYGNPIDTISKLNSCCAQFQQIKKKTKNEIMLVRFD